MLGILMYHYVYVQLRGMSAPLKIAAQSVDEMTANEVEYLLLKDQKEKPIGRFRLAEVVGYYLSKD